MSESKPRRTPSQVTLRCRAFAKAERLKAQIANATTAENERRRKHDQRIEKLREQHAEAEIEYKELETVVVP